MLRTRLLTLAFALIATAGCSSTWWRLSLPGGDVVMTTAETRAIHQTRPLDGSPIGRVRPAVLNCAEPSPDIAVAVSKAFGAAASAAANLPNGIEPKLAIAVSRTQAQSMAQLTERLATIQLLRDGLHRACEAYANGAISDTTYAVMLSRFDKMMVTMLLGEMTAGAFGRTLAGLGTEAESAVTSSLDHSEKKDESRNIESQLNRVDERKGPLEAKEAAGTASEAEKRELADVRKSSETLKRDLIQALKAEAKSASRTSNVTATGAISAPKTAEIAHELAEMQRKYIENLNFDAVEVACMSALDRITGAATQPTPLVTYCSQTLLPEIQRAKVELLKPLIERANSERDRAKQRATTTNLAAEVEAYLNDIKRVLDAYGGLKK